MSNGSYKGSMNSTNDPSQTISLFSSEHGIKLQYSQFVYGTQVLIRQFLGFIGIADRY